MSKLFLSDNEKANLNHTIASLEAVNGANVYCNPICHSSGCGEWDCFFSCHCANSYK
jgi:DUF1680 family protein